QRSHEYPEYDVVLDIPNVCVEKIYLKVDSVTARISLNAQVANLLRVNAGADVLIGNVDLTIQGVRAQALLLVDLDDVVRARGALSGGPRRRRARRRSDAHVHRQPPRGREPAHEHREQPRRRRRWT